MPSQKDQTSRHHTIQAALQAFKNPPPNSKNPSIRAISTKFGVSEATLRRAIRNGGPAGLQGRGNVLTENEEKQLVGYCMNMQKLGFGLTRSGVTSCVLEIMRQNKRPHPFGEGGPGKSWWTRFMRDHPDLSFRVPQALSEARAQKANLVVVKDHFDKLGTGTLAHS